mmetsp:Transcript_16289/g.35663  ORF Transcript_16289/g.35663 Transcript_16289/m.35663 type:complete len:86 (-) Transcript_16289:1334-1591(-)
MTKLSKKSLKRSLARLFKFSTAEVAKPSALQAMYLVAILPSTLQEMLRLKLRRGWSKKKPTKGLREPMLEFVRGMSRVGALRVPT